MSKRKEQAEKTKQEIVTAFLSLIQEKSLDNIKITDVCKKAEVSVGTYYYYFKDKKECIREIIYELNEKLTSQMQMLEKRTLKSSLFMYIELLCKEIEEEIGLNAAVNINQCQMEFESEFFLNVQGPFSCHIYQILDVYKNDSVKDKVLEEVTRDLSNMIRGSVYSWSLLRGKMDLKNTLKNMMISYMEEAPEFQVFV